MLNFLDVDTAAGHRVLDAVETRSRTLLHNLANQNTPGFKRYEVRFEEMLRDASARGESPGDVYPEVVRIDDGDPAANNVDVMRELANLDKVKLLHDVFSRRVGGYFSHLKSAIYGRPGS